MIIDPFPPNTKILYNDAEDQKHEAVVLEDDPILPSCPNANHRLIQLTGIVDCQVVTHVDNLEVVS
jgi:hypothetical protein